MHHWLWIEISGIANIVFNETFASDDQNGMHGNQRLVPVRQSMLWLTAHFVALSLEVFVGSSGPGPAIKLSKIASFVLRHVSSVNH